MAKLAPSSSSVTFLVAIILSVSLIDQSAQLEFSQFQALLRLQQLLNSPPPLNSFFNTSDLCSIEPSQTFTLACYGDNLTQLHINGQTGGFPLPRGFSTRAFFSTITAFSSLKVLSVVSLGLQGPLPAVLGNLSSLEILNASSNRFIGEIPKEMSSLKGLQSLILDDNAFSGQVPAWFGSLPAVAVLSLKNNSLSGPLPRSFTAMRNLRVLALSGNNLSGEIPNLHRLHNLQVIDLEGNHFGPRLPSMPTRLVTLVLRKNKFGLGLPSELASYYQLKKLDVSMNGFVGPFLPFMLTLPSIQYLDISGNRFTGLLMSNMSCNPELTFVNLSSNLLLGTLPDCLLSDQTWKVALYADNCLSGEVREQHPSSFCHKEALAVPLLPAKKKHDISAHKTRLALGVLGGILGGIATSALVLIAVRKINARQKVKSPPARLLTENASTLCNVKLLSDARYISQTMKMGATIPTYRTFALEELKNATNNFDSSSLISEGSNYQIYRAKLADGIVLAIRRLEMRKKRTPQSYMPDIEQISKLRHGHLSSAIGHCFECYPDDSTVSRIYLIFEFTTNGTLRDHISGKGILTKKLTWVQRIVSALGVVKGIQFLHTGTVPGVFSNDLKITDVLLDHSLQVKINKYNLPLLADDRKVSSRVSLPRTERSPHSRVKYKGGDDVYDIGVILLEIIVGRPIMYQNEVTLLKDLLQVCLVTDEVARRSIADPAVQKDCSDESLRTMMQICLRCISPDETDRPSVEDVLWNLQFAIQVQESSKEEPSENETETAIEENFVNVPF
ncbi:probable inactive leucine-rich repeat receptor-like protein kinase At3g03770 isoform X2 [Punica granatum]|uniref:Probable inactive leucine-rich repeat receptor-like protein kinase At3g03770 isoform X2 n=1 Tax=Punica granatum TaxID=22663 RepID=A0A218XS81_PUNGR|nr:probable inactive leucine-rich repeat receptor-like protein kinase At3g03770 isoform X2 [Punica granatum]OWM87680.1 hypothetical protein CDL15_Pgr022793 [Punica granatum]